jgi:hypothetical protein
MRHYQRERLEPKVIVGQYHESSGSKFTGVLVSPGTGDGHHYTAHWYKNGIRHREFEPATVYNNGYHWLLNDYNYGFSRSRDKPPLKYLKALYRLYRDTDPKKAQLVMAKILGNNDV